MKLTSQRIREVLQYNLRTGVFRWKVGWRFVQKGDVAGAIRLNGYRQIRVDGTIYMASRLAFLWMTGKWPNKIVDHVNGIKDDDRWSNLRQANHSQNGGNMRGRSSTGFKGVRLDKRRGKYYAQIGNNRRVKNLGGFNNPEDAHAAYCAAAKKIYGQFARYQ